MLDDPGTSAEPSQPTHQARTRKALADRKPAPTAQTCITIASARWTVRVMDGRVTVELR
jgi:hypothetical protein